jgi:hypothetical protein
MARLRYVLFFAAFAVRAQHVSFDAAAVRPHQQVTGLIAPTDTENPIRVTYRNYSLKRLLGQAYGLADYQVQGPAWLAREPYDVTATRPRRTTPEQTRLMMQSLLTERFHLALQKNTSKLGPAKDATQVPGCHSFGTITEFAELLSHLLDKPVADQTAIAGTYYFILYIVPTLNRLAQPGQAAPPPPPPAAPTPCPG